MQISYRTEQLLHQASLCPVGQNKANLLVTKALAALLCFVPSVPIVPRVQRVHRVRAVLRPFAVVEVCRSFFITTILLSVANMVKSIIDAT